MHEFLFTCGRLFLANLLVVAGVMSGSLVVAEPMANKRVLQVRTAYLYNFVKFIDWPELHPKKTSQTINVCVSGSGEIVKILQALEARKAKGRPLKIIPLSASGQSAACNLVYFTDKAEVNQNQLREFQKKSTLTVGGGRSFVPEGGMVGLVLIDDHVRIQMNYERVKAAGILVSANLMEVALIVND